MPKTEDRPGYHLVYAAYITLKNGKRLYASEIGKRCFVFCVKNECQYNLLALQQQKPCGRKAR